MTEETKPPMIFPAIIAIMRAVGPIAKDQQAPQYKFRGIDQVYNACHAHFAEHGVFSTSEVMESQHTTEPSKGSGGKEVLLCRSILKMRFTYFAADGSSVYTEVVGEGLDYGGDKASNKAMSAADKYALLQLLKIPTAMVDSDRTPAARNGNAPTSTPRGQREVCPEQITEIKEQWKAEHEGATATDWVAFVRRTVGRPDMNVTTAGAWKSEDVVKVRAAMEGETI